MSPLEFMFRFMALWPIPEVVFHMTPDNNLHAYFLTRSYMCMCGCVGVVILKPWLYGNPKEGKLIVH